MIVSLQKAFFRNLVTKKTLPVQFNPTELSFNKTAQFAEIAIPGLDQPVLQFIRGGTETLSVDLFFDTTDDGMGQDAKSVADEIYEFYDLVKQNKDTHAPPKCVFAWGPPVVKACVEQFSEHFNFSLAPSWFVCIVESIDRKFLLFSPEGIPLRARLTVKMREYQTVEQMVAGLHSADHTKMRVLKRRERLDQISVQEYETPAEWRMIAEANDIDNPRLVPPGTMLEIPPMRTDSVTRKTR
jgi:nucleoid-associated protein YgaU